MENNKRALFSDDYDMCSIEYELTDKKNKTINFLYDYSKVLHKNNYRDKKIAKWQRNHIMLLKQMGVAILVKLIITISFRMKRKKAIF
jgi:hypothetical protein